jgi:amino acid transporter
VLRKRDADLERPFRAGKGNLVGIAALVLSVALFLVYLPGSPAALIWPYEWLIVLLWTLIGAGLYVRTRIIRVRGKT